MYLFSKRYEEEKPPQLQRCADIPNKSQKASKCFQNVRVRRSGFADSGTELSVAQRSNHRKYPSDGPHHQRQAVRARIHENSLQGQQMCGETGENGETCNTVCTENKMVTRFIYDDHTFMQESRSLTFGETKIPEPIIFPTMRQTPWRREISCFSLTPLPTDWVSPSATMFTNLFQRSKAKVNIMN